MPRVLNRIEIKEKLLLKLQVASDFLSYMQLFAHIRNLCSYSTAREEISLLVIDGLVRQHSQGFEITEDGEKELKRMQEKRNG